ncbi:unnamed protein product [Rotaria sp. Silwood2]|nr:unnamed protein product [Rotaria sp. Silwood2]
MMDFTRFLQFSAVFIIATLALFSSFITFFTVILLSWFWSLPVTLTICLIYGCWMYFDRHTDSQGGRWSNRIRRLPIFTHFVNYFSLNLIKSEDLDTNRNYIFGFHPHGFWSLSAFGNFATDATYFSTLFPNIRSHLMILRLQFLCPFTRELCLSLGLCDVSKDSCEYLLSGKSGQGNALVIIIGGVREAIITRNDTMKLYLKNRQGFVRLALKYGASLVPVVSFGENELYRRHARCNLIPNGIIWGRLLAGHMPFRHPVVTVVGKPIHVKQNTNPTSEDVDKLHHEYLQAVEELFEVNKHKYRLEHKTVHRADENQCPITTSNNTTCSTNPEVSEEQRIAYGSASVICQPYNLPQSYVCIQPTPNSQIVNQYPPNNMVTQHQLYQQPVPSTINVPSEYVQQAMLHSNMNPQPALVSSYHPPVNTNGLFTSSMTNRTISSTPISATTKRSRYDISGVSALNAQERPQYYQTTHIFNACNTPNKRHCGINQQQKESSYPYRYVHNHEEQLNYNIMKGGNIAESTYDQQQPSMAACRYATSRFPFAPFSVIFLHQVREKSRHR